MTRVVMFSGGIGSWAAAKRVVAQHGPAATVLLFTDTRMEDEDLYRFLTEAAANVGAQLVTLADGRDPWQVFADKRFLGNTRVDPCSRILKREQATAWLEANCDPASTVVSVGIDWTEVHRFVRLRDRYAALGWSYDAPLCDAPYLSKPQLLAWARAEQLRPPRLYALGFAHNNCGGFCIKAGHGHFARLLRELPERFAYHEHKEEQLRAVLGNVSILADHTPTGKRPLTLRTFRERVESGLQPDLFDIGGCGCYVDALEEPEVDVA